jgi:hypothetical protein
MFPMFPMFPTSRCSMTRHPEARPGPRLLHFQPRRQTPQQQVAGQFTERLADIENFVILAS